jgi:hypothetical protein
MGEQTNSVISRSEVERVRKEQIAAEASAHAFRSQQRIRFYRGEGGVVRLEAKFPNGDLLDRPATKADLEDPSFAQAFTVFQRTDEARK